jgi:hypothetical protein
MKKTGAPLTGDTGPDQDVQRVEVRGIEPRASTVRLLRSTN